MKKLVYTIGHSTRPIEEFIELLKKNRVSRLCDIRSIPKSRHNPQYLQTKLAKSLAKAEVEYIYLPGLGGRRHSKKDSINMGWRNTSFRGYADYMQTDEFDAALKELMKLARERRTAIMCAEAVPWRCHRSLVGDALLVRGFEVEDIISLTSNRPHAMTSFAKVRGKQITYPGDTTSPTMSSRAERKSL